MWKEFFAVNLLILMLFGTVSAVHNIAVKIRLSVWSRSLLKMKLRQTAEVHARRVDTEQVDWNKCIFCQSENTKEHLSCVMMLKMSDRIIEASKVNYTMRTRLSGIIDLIAAEAKCYSAFIRSVERRMQKTVIWPWLGCATSLSVLQKRDML